MAHETPHERGKRHLKAAGYHRAKGGDIHNDTAEDEALIRKMVKRGSLKRKAGGHVPGHEPKHRPDRRARGGLAAGGMTPDDLKAAYARSNEAYSKLSPDERWEQTTKALRPLQDHEMLNRLGQKRGGRISGGIDGLGDWPNDAQGNENAKSALARGGAHKEHKEHKGGKTVINIHQGDPQREQMAHQQGMQQGAQLGARAAAAKLAGAGAAPGGPPRPPMGGAPMMPPPGGMPPGMPTGGPPMAPPAARPPMAGPPPGMPMRRAGGRV